jgi:hypothetical protein
VRWRDPKAAGRQEERRRRESEAPRLADTVPGLEKLRLDVLERSPNVARPEHTHTRHVVVDRAPALFVLPCYDTQCKDGGHDLTAEIMAALKAKRVRFEGEDLCPGMVGTASCSRVLGYVGLATYQTTVTSPTT